MHSIRSRELEAPDMAIILAIALTSLVLIVLAVRAFDAAPYSTSRLTVADIQARLAAEAPCRSAGGDDRWR